MLTSINFCYFICDKLKKEEEKDFHDAYMETFEVLAAFFSKKLLTFRGVIFPTVKHHGELQLEKFKS